MAGSSMRQKHGVREGRERLSRWPGCEWAGSWITVTAMQGLQTPAPTRPGSFHQGSGPHRHHGKQADIYPG